MAWYPKAVKKRLPENDTEPKIDPTVVIFHSAAVNVSSLYDAFNRGGNSIESHFFVKWDGTVEQYMDTTRQADANRYANDFAISVETEDDGDPNNQPWSKAQLQAMVDLFNWLVQTHPKIQRRECPKWNAAGFGYHTMWGAPSQWTPVAKSCPGTIRKKQYYDALRPQLLTLPGNPVSEDEVQKGSIYGAIRRVEDGSIWIILDGPVKRFQHVNMDTYSALVAGGLCVTADDVNAVEFDRIKAFVLS